MNWLIQGNAKSERELYPDIIAWLEARLPALYPGWAIKAYDTSRVRLSGFLDRHDLSDAFPGCEGFEIEVDVTGILQRGTRVQLAFVECKSGYITLKDLGQILGYSRVALPAISVIVSPLGLSSCMNVLMHTHNRVDLLEYGGSKRIKLATWDKSRRQVDPQSVFPPGELG
ncbi:MAG: hypothetical protein L0Z50_18405 [Verrucomicrobiales bacterium]|nr:hypothetical protein [Verrucomicrobiales bacterium]